MDHGKVEEIMKNSPQDYTNIPDALRVLADHESGPWKKSAAERAAMTIESPDSIGIPRVKEAGKTLTQDGKEVQIMHNGVRVMKHSYQGQWQAETIEKLRGIHEPQEEKVFQEILTHIGKGATMMELGSWWSYYSLWFLKNLPGSLAICCEPDPKNLEVGKANMALNGFDEGERVVFYDAASGNRDGQKLEFTNEDGSKQKVTVRTVDSILNEQKLQKLDLLHLDIQGAELAALQGAIESIKSGKIRFVFVSTHHYLISENPIIHQQCVEFIKEHGGHIIARHSVIESSSGDGLIVASFDKKDADMKISITPQPSDDALFREYEYDIDILWKAYSELAHNAKKDTSRLAKELEVIKQQNAVLQGQSAVLQGQLNEIAHLKDHIKRQVKIRATKLKPTRSK